MTKRSSINTTKPSTTHVKRATSVSSRGETSLGCGEVATRPLTGAEVKLLASLANDQHSLHAQFPGIERLLEAALTEHRIQQQKLYTTLLAEYGDVLNSTKRVQSDLTRSQEIIQGLSSNPAEFKRRAIRRIRTITFNELRLPALIDRRKALC